MQPLLRCAIGHGCWAAALLPLPTRSSATCTPTLQVVLCIMTSARSPRSLRMSVSLFCFRLVCVCVAALARMCLSITGDGIRLEGRCALVSWGISSSPHLHGCVLAPAAPALPVASLTFQPYSCLCKSTARRPLAVARAHADTHQPHKPWSRAPLAAAAAAGSLSLPSFACCC